MTLSPDSIVYWKWGPIALNATIVFTWVIMIILIFIAWLATRKLTIETEIPPWQNFLEIVITYMRDQIHEIMQKEQDVYLPFLGSLFLFISVANFLTIVPGYQAPTGSLSTTTALALCVFLAVPFYGISERGLLGYLRHYIQPSIFMLPFHLMGEVSRTLALSIRLFGNIMSGPLIGALLLSIVPLVVPIIMNVFGLLIGQIQAYIFAVLAAVYIASGIQAGRGKIAKNEKEQEGEE